MKKIPQQKSNGNDHLLVMQEKAKKDLAKFLKDKGYLFDIMKNVGSDIGRASKMIDLSGLAKNMIVPAQHLSRLSKQITALSKNFQVSVPNNLQENLQRMAQFYQQTYQQEEITYVPRIRNDFDDMQVGLERFTKKIENKIEEKFIKLNKSIENMTGENATSKDSGFGKNIIFDEAKSILRIGNKVIKLRKGGDQYHFLRIIFEDRNELTREWFYSEIAEKFDFSGKFDDKKFYNAAYQINQKIIKDTGFRDILITTLHSARINPDYIS